MLLLLRSLVREKMMLQLLMSLLRRSRLCLHIGLVRTRSAGAGGQVLQIRNVDWISRPKIDSVFDRLTLTLALCLSLGEHMRTGSLPLIERGPCFKGC